MHRESLGDHETQLEVYCHGCRDCGDNHTKVGDQLGGLLQSI